MFPIAKNPAPDSSTKMILTVKPTKVLRHDEVETIAMNKVRFMVEVGEVVALTGTSVVVSLHCVTDGFA